MTENPFHEKPIRKVNGHEQHSDETSFRNSHLQLQQLIDFLPDATFAIDCEGQIIVWNRAMEELTGMAARDMLAKGDHEYALPFYGTRRPILIDLILNFDNEIEKKYSYVRREKDTLFAEIELSLPDGKQVYLSGKARPIYDNSGSIVGAIESIRDITDLKHTQRSYKESQKRLEQLIDFLPDPTFAIDCKGKVIVWNRALEELTGVKAPDMIGIGDYAYAEAFYEMRRPMLVDLVFVPDEEIECRYVYVRRERDILLAEGHVVIQGSKRYLWGKASPIYDQEGVVVGAIESVRDITEQKNSSLEIQESEKRYRDIFENVSDFLYTHDMKGNFIETNLSFKDEYGYTHEDLDKMKIQDLIPENFKQQYHDYIKRVIDQDRDEGLISIKSKDGSIHIFEYINSLVRDETGEPQYIRGSARDVTERKKAEQALRNSEERFRQMVEQSPNAIAIVNSDGSAEYCNKKFTDIFGYTKNDISSLDDWFRLAYPDKRYRDMIRTEFMRDVEVFPTRGYTRKTYEVCCKDGKILSIIFRVVILEQGKILITFEDITDQKKADLALRESEERYRLLAENVHDVIWIIDIENLRYTYISPSVERMRGYSVEEAMAYPMDKFITPESFNNARRILAEQLELDRMNMKAHDHRLPMFEAEQICKDGTKIWTEISTSFIRDKDGRPTHILGVTRDITDRKKAELARIESEQRFSMIAQASPVIFWMTSPDYSRVIYVSPAFEKIYGYPCEALQDNPKLWLDVIHEEDADHTEQIVNQNPRSDCIIEYRIIRPDGSIRWIRDKISPVCNENGEVLLLTGLAEDITQQKKAEEERMIYETRLNNAQKMEAIGTLAGGIAHDFNNILSAIIGYTELSLDDIPRTSSLYTNLEEVLKAGDRAKDLVRQILTFSRQVDMEKRPVKMHLIVKEALKLLRSTIPSTIRIIQEIDPASGAVLADPTQIHQVIMNLCTNAYQAMADKGGELRVCLTPENIDAEFCLLHPNLIEGNYIRLSVHDTGCGMSSTIIDRIFDPFFTTKDKAKGTGLGLAIVHGIATNLGGDITVSSTPGKGSSFDVYLPRFEADIGEKIFRQEEVPAGNGEHILLIDDEEAILHFGKNMLEQLGYCVSIASASTKALEMFNRDPAQFDLVITDQTMPNITGEKLASKMLLLRPDLPIILMTGHSETITAKKAMNQGISFFMEKPFSRYEIAKAINEALKGK